MGDFILQVPSGAIDPHQQVLWAWNGVNVSQFGDGVGGPTPGESTGSPAGALTVDALPVPTSPDVLDASPVAILKHTHDGSAPNANAIYLINDLPSLPDRFVIEGRLGTEIGANTKPRLVVVYQDSDHVFYVLRDGGFIDLRTGNGNDGITTFAYARLADSLTDRDEGRYFRVLVDVRDPDATHDPGVMIAFHAVDQDDAQHKSKAMFAATSGWSGVGAPSGGWDGGWRAGGTIKRPGIAFGEEGTAGEAWISDLRILTWVAA